MSYAAFSVGDRIEVRRDSTASGSWQSVAGGELSYKATAATEIRVARFLLDAGNDAVRGLSELFDSSLGRDWQHRARAASNSLARWMFSKDLNRLTIAGNKVQPIADPEAMAAAAVVIAWTYLTRERGACFYEPNCRRELLLIREEALNRSELADGF